jgi:phosphoserine phosphatase
MDSTIVTSETLDELAAFAGLGERIAAITARAMNGELDFKDALRERVAMLKGLSVDALERTWQKIRLTPGALELVATMKAHGAYTALVSGGFTFFTSRVAALVGFDMHRSNTLLDDGTTLTGRVAEPILDRSAKLATLTELAARHGLAMSETLATGDGANDLDMLLAAGLGVAFHAKPIVAAAARARVDHAGLRALLFAQGYSASEFASVS